jgi:hypothetical protein
VGAADGASDALAVGAGETVGADDMVGLDDGGGETVGFGEVVGAAETCGGRRSVIFFADASGGAKKKAGLRRHC